jgi:hypothetical protein
MKRNMYAEIASRAFNLPYEVCAKEGNIFTRKVKKAVLVMAYDSSPRAIYKLTGLSGRLITKIRNVIKKECC